MSQAGVITNGGVGPVPTIQFQADDGGIATPDGGGLVNVNSADTTDNHDNGIFTEASGNTIDILLTNRLTGDISTANATPTTIISFSPAIAGVYSFEFNVAAFNTTDTLGAAYSVFVGSITDGATTMTKLNLEDKIVNEQVGMASCDVSVSVSGTAILLQVTGLAGKTINWRAVGTYVFRGA